MKNEKDSYSSVGLEITGALILALLFKNGLNFNLPLLILVPVLFIPVHYLNGLSKNHQEKAKISDNAQV